MPGEHTLDDRTVLHDDQPWLPPAPADPEPVAGTPHGLALLLATAAMVG
jgi:hypothetical protein